MCCKWKFRANPNPKPVNWPPYQNSVSFKIFHVACVLDPFWIAEMFLECATYIWYNIYAQTHSLCYNIIIYIW